MSGDGPGHAPPPGRQGSIDSTSSSGRRRRLLYTPEDDECLSDLMCLIRRQIEVFAATPDDIATRAHRGGARQHFEVGRVGIRCIHCADLPMTESRARGAVHYPASVRIVHQAVRNWQRYHFGSCGWIPEEVKKQYRSFQGTKTKSKKTSNEYWVESCVRLGMVDAEDGIFFAESVKETGDDCDLDCARDCSSVGDNCNKSVRREIEADHLDATVGDATSDVPISSVRLADTGLGMEGQDDTLLPELTDLDLDIFNDAGPDPHSIDHLIGEKHENVDVSDCVIQPLTNQEFVARSVQPLQPSEVVSRSAPSQPCKSMGRVKELVYLAYELVEKKLEMKSAPLVQPDTSGSSSYPNVRGDLFSVGMDMYKLFTGCHPLPDVDSKARNSNSATFEGLPAADSPHRKREKRSVTGEVFHHLREHDLPTSLCSLVSNLLGESSNCLSESSEDGYRTLREVLEDLRLMMADPERYLFDAAVDKLTGQLEFPPGKLYGREQALSRLRGVFDRVLGFNSPSEMVFISGYSGTGKSVLVDHLRRPLVEKGGHFISAKFDELGQVQPMAVIFAAFNDFCSNLIEEDEGQLFQTRMAIDDALGANVNVLTGLIPNLSTVMGVTSPSLFDIGGKEALNRFLFCFRLFVRAIASPSHPVVLFLDDLQWADKSTLELITTLVLDREARSLLFVAGHRDNEVGLEHSLNVAAANIACAGVTVTSTKLENIDGESVNALISDTLHLLPRLTRSLANVVHAKTSGNPLFVVQFLQSLCDEKLLQYSASSRRWEWNVEAIQSKDISDNVVDLIKHKMLRLDPDAQKLLKEAACLGSRSELSTLKLLSFDGDTSGSSIKSILDRAVDEGLMCRIGSSYTSSYKFSHDQIQEAAYYLIPENEREAMHLEIGRLMWKRASEEELKGFIFIVVDQLSRGSNLISDHSEKVQIARLCLLAGEKAVKASSFLPASIYLLQGTALLEESDWEHHYELSLDLFSTCAEAQYTIGNYEGVAITLNPVWKHGRNLQDKIRGYYTLLESLGSQGKPFDVITLGLEVVAGLGETFPNEIHANDIMNDLAKTRAMLEGKTSDDILQMKVMENASMAEAMKFLTNVARFAYSVQQQLMSLTIFRMIRLTLCHGICRESSFAFASYGVVLCSFGEYKEGHLYGKLALSILERFDAKEYLPRVYLAVYAFVFIFTEPVQAALPLLKHGHEIGTSMGDNEWAFTNAHSYVLCALQCGCKLDALEEETRAYLKQMKMYKHYSQYSQMMIRPNHQTILNLMGCSKDPTVLTGEAMDQEELLNRMVEEGFTNMVCFIYYARMWLAYLFGRYDLAADMAKRRQEICKARPVRLETVVNETFYTGLIAAAMERESAEGEWKSIALDAAEKMKTWAASSSWNFEHKLALLNAEIAYINRDMDSATKAYDDAIRIAGDHSAIHEKALACERAGIFYSQEISPFVASDYFERSHKHFVQWGAKSKADDVRRRLGNE